MKKFLLILVFSMCMTACGFVSNVTTIDAVQTHLIPDRKFRLNYADNLPMGGAYQDVIIGYHGIRNAICNPRNSLSDYIGLSIAIPMVLPFGAADVVLSAAGDIITLPYTSYKTFFAKKMHKDE